MKWKPSLKKQKLISFCSFVDRGLSFDTVEMNRCGGDFVFLIHHHPLSHTHKLKKY